MPNAAPEAAPPFRCGYVAIIGEPNVGKSTFMNRLLAQKISIVTKKPQTTRHKILGILSTPACQAIFLDTPGIITPKYPLHEAMMASSAAAVREADLVLFMADATRPGSGGDPAEGAIFGQIAAAGKPAWLILNKVDLVAKPVLLPMIGQYAARHPFAEIFPLSALTGEGVDALLERLPGVLPAHPALYPPDVVSDQQERFFVAEIIREKIFIRCREEIPYATTVEITAFHERENAARGRKKPKWFVSADITVEKESQKGIVIGKKGALLKEIGELARKDIERFLDHGVFLELHVKVREGWRTDRQWLERLGYRQ
ncbi:MAG TPA: GTPase Era [Bacteroidota bacterium]|nr:GTPase Era [Bacteroidota bacterium]